MITRARVRVVAGAVAVVEEHRGRERVRVAHHVGAAGRDRDVLVLEDLGGHRTVQRIAVTRGPRDRAAAGNRQGGAGLPITTPAVAEVKVSETWPLALVVSVNGPAGVAVAPLLSVKVMITDVPAPTGL